MCADRIDLLQPSEFAFLMHVVGRLRDFPGITDKKKESSSTEMRALF